MKMRHWPTCKGKVCVCVRERELVIAGDSESERERELSHLLLLAHGLTCLIPLLQSCTLCHYPHYAPAAQNHRWGSSAQENTTAKVNFLTQPQIRLSLVTILKESISRIDQCCLWVGSFVRADEAVLRNLSQPEPLLSVHERCTEIHSAEHVSCLLSFSGDRYVCKHGGLAQGSQWGIGMKWILPLTPALNWLWHLKRCVRQDVCINKLPELPIGGFPLERRSFTPFFSSSREPVRPPCFIDRCCCYCCSHVSFTSNLTFSPMIRTGLRPSNFWWWNRLGNIHRNEEILLLCVMRSSSLFEQTWNWFSKS